MNDKREKLAELEHDQWAHWTKHMLEMLRPVIGLGFYEARDHGLQNHTDIVKAREALARWNHQINTPYADLTERQKDSDRVWADKVLAELDREAGRRNLDGDIIRVVQGICSHAHFVVETPDESVLVKLMEERGNPIDIDGSVRPIEEDYRRYLKDKEADWKEDQKSLAKEVEQWGEEDLAQQEITQNTVSGGTAENLENTFRIGLVRMEKAIKERDATISGMTKERDHAWITAENQIDALQRRIKVAESRHLNEISQLQALMDAKVADREETAQRLVSGALILLMCLAAAFAAFVGLS